MSREKFICPLCDIEFKSDPFDPKLSAYERSKKMAYFKLIRHAAKVHKFPLLRAFASIKDPQYKSAKVIKKTIIDMAMEHEFKK